MIARRYLLGTTLLSGLAGTSAPAPEQTGQLTERQAQDIADALKGIRAAIEAQGSFSEIGRLRQLQMDHLRASGRFPDFIDAGSDIWFGVHDWHVRHQQPINLGRDATGRHTILLLSTAIVLRPDMAPSSIGVPYDTK